MKRDESRPRLLLVFSAPRHTSSRRTSFIFVGLIFSANLFMVDWIFTGNLFNGDRIAILKPPFWVTFYVVRSYCSECIPAVTPWLCFLHLITCCYLNKLRQVNWDPKMWLWKEKNENFKQKCTI